MNDYISASEISIYPAISLTSLGLSRSAWVLIAIIVLFLSTTKSPADELMEIPLPAVVSTVAMGDENLYTISLPRRLLASSVTSPATSVIPFAFAFFY